MRALRPLPSPEKQPVLSTVAHMNQMKVPPQRPKVPPHRHGSARRRSVVVETRRVAPRMAPHWETHRRKRQTGYQPDVGLPCHPVLLLPPCSREPPQPSFPLRLLRDLVPENLHEREYNHTSLSRMHGCLRSPPVTSCELHSESLEDCAPEHGAMVQSWEMEHSQPGA